LPPGNVALRLFRVNEFMAIRARQLPTLRHGLIFFSVSTKMPASITLGRQLEMLEQKWFAVLKTELAHKPLPHAASGEIQFFSTDFPLTYVAAKDTRDVLPSDGPGSAICVLCLGMTHNVYRNRTEADEIVPHIFTRRGGKSWTVDVGRTRATRRALNTALASYAMKRKAWVENGYASADDLLPSAWDGREADLPLVVIKTVLSPFVLKKPWPENTGAVRKETLAAWDPNRHICDCIAELGGTVGLWVIHGNNVWPHFATNSTSIPNWILAPTLTYASQQNSAIESFWKTPREDTHLRHPYVPSC
jgi:hypothetical protein